MTVIVDGYLTGLGAAVWALGAILGIATAFAPGALGGWLLTRTISALRTSRPAWAIRARRSIRRTRGS